MVPDKIQESIPKLNLAGLLYIFHRIFAAKSLAFLSLMLIPGTELYNECKKEAFTELKPQELITELYEIISRLELKRTFVRASHASNYLPVEGWLPRDKEKLLSIIKTAIDGKVILRPELLRGL